MVGEELVYMQYNISDSQALFWCPVFILLEMASLALFSYVLPDASLASFLARSQFLLPNPRRVVELTWWPCDLKIKTSTSSISLRSHPQQHFSRNFEKFLRVQLLLTIPQDVSFCSAISRYGAQLKLHD